MEKNRFKTLLESKLGSVQTLLTEQDWSKFPCVTNYKGATTTKLSDGSIVYTINNVDYYNNGRKDIKPNDSKVPMSNYTCNDPEFKTQTTNNTQTTQESGGTQVKQGGGGDPYQYKKENGKFYYAKKGQENWTEQTKETGIESICTRIFGEAAGCSKNVNPSTETSSGFDIV